MQGSILLTRFGGENTRRLMRFAPLYPVRIRSGPLVTWPGMNGTRWNASLPGIVNPGSTTDSGCAYSSEYFMTDPRYKKLARLLVEYSTQLKKGDRVLLDMIDVPDEFSIELMRAARAAGATPVIEVRHTRINREMLRATNDQHASLVRDLELFRMKKMQAYIAVRGSDNASENADVAERSDGALFPRPLARSSTIA